MGSKNTEMCWHSEGIRYIQGGGAQTIGKKSDGENIKRYHYLGEKNSFGQIYLTRNCLFEPNGSQWNKWEDVFNTIEFYFTKCVPVTI